MTGLPRDGGGRPLRCALYCRISREDPGDKAESESVVNQKALLTELAARNGWEIAKVYADEDYSGADRDRPAFKSLIADAEAGLFDVVLCKTQSRFTRDMELVERYLHTLFPLWGIRFVAPVDNADSSVKGNKKARQINGLINEWYLEDLSENIRAVLEYKRRDGQFIGSFAPYGYQRDEKDGHRLAVDGEAAAVVREIFTLFLSGHGKESIARLLNARRVPSPAVYKAQKGFAYRQGDAGTGWSKTTVGRILRNECYVGTLVQGKRKRVSYKSKKLADLPKEQWARVEGTHEAIISHEVFSEVQKRLAARTRSDGRGKRHLLAGRVRCALCGGAMVKTSVVYRGRTHRYLRCKRAALGEGCSCPSVDLDGLTETTRARLARLVGEELEPGLLARLAASDSGRDRKRRETEELSARLRAIDRSLKALYQDKTEGVVTPEEFDMLRREFSAERAVVVRRMEEAGEEEAESAPSDAFAPIREADERLVGALVDRIEVGPPDGEGKREIAIHWNI